VFETKNIFFSKRQLHKSLKIFSTESNFKRQNNAFNETLFYGYFLGNLTLKAHHLNYNVDLDSLFEGILIKGCLIFIGDSFFL
jgi:hypothetical protein